MGTSREALREREVLKYDGDYASRSIINVRGATHTNPEIEARLKASSPLPPVLSTAADSGLTSLAQLAAFRLNCKRALISLYDRNFQYVVAEATQAVPLTPDVIHTDLWLCGTGIPRSHGICEHVLIAPQGETLPVSVVPDLAQDSRFCDRHYIHHAPFNRFYAGVPIRSSKGINIGVLCVFDEKPHDGLEEDAVQYLRDLSRNIMSHLEARRVRDAASRHEKMVRGLGSFVDGDEQISGLDHKQSSNPPIQIIEDPPDSEENGALYVRQDELKRQLEEHEAAQLDQPFKTEEARATTECLLEVTDKPARPVDPASVRSNSDSRLHQNPATQAPATNMTDAQGPSHFSEVKHIFAKAANIIRESIDVDGVVFLDASIRSFGGLVDFNGVAAEAPFESLSSASSGDEAMTDSSIHEERTYGSPFCSVLGFSTHKHSSLRNDAPDPGYSFVKEKFLRSLLRRFPKGHIINFDSDGVVLPSDSSSSEDDALPNTMTLKRTSRSSDDSTASRPRSRANWLTQANLLLTTFPGIRSLAILPVWDASRERWYAGGFVYTTSSSRIFTSEVELGFLRTFGKAMQTELIQVETIFSEKAKSDALGSLSHELRSPLHGLLGACELLHDTPMSAFQRDMVRMAETSGRTLLDVIDHLLDYSKMSSIRGLPEQSTSGPRKSANLSFFDTKNQHLAAVDIDLIVEEVVESVFTGHNFQKVIGSDISRRQPQGCVGPYAQNPNTLEYSTHLQLADNARDSNQVTVYLDIDHGHSWQMLAYPGAVRRIVMNLLGNSLKFTNDGFIFISLKQEASSKTKRGADVVLTIIDSGRGISEDFLQHQLFKPFAQEDKLSPGAGLGLNVVKQIVNMLLGHITVLSQPGLGTKTVVTIPLTYAAESTPSSSIVSSSLDLLKGQTVHLMGFNNVLHTHFLASRRMGERTLLTRLCRDWFGMTLAKAPDWEAESRLGVLIADESCLEEIEKLQSQGYTGYPVVIVCHSSITAHDLSNNSRKLVPATNLHFITQPIGPRKLAEAITFSMQQFRHNANDAQAALKQDLLTSDSVHEAARTMLSVDEVLAQSTADDTVTEASAVPRAVSSSPSTLSDEATSAAAATPTTPPLPEADAGLEASTKDLVAKLQKVDISMSDSASPVVETKREELRFLVVDDNKINVQILSSFLRKLKKLHSTAMDGLEALETYISSPGHFDYVFMDISMPRMDGLEATRRIRMFEREQKLPPAKIIALTGLVSEDMQKEAFASGIDLFLTKPVKLQQLKDIIAQDVQRANK